MKASELRVGNWVNTPEGVYQVIDVLCDSVNTIAQYSLPYDWIDPIPLTPEILEKCGFELLPFRQAACQLKRLRIWIGTGSCLSYLKYEDIDDSVYIGELKHLHQLQNLFHALTGEELNYQP